MLLDDPINAAAIRLDVIPVPNDTAASRQRLEERINYLIQHDFNRLISILYRLDINESKLKISLDQNAAVDAATIIADLVIERERQKIASRQQFGASDLNIDEDERW